MKKNLLLLLPVTPLLCLTGCSKTTSTIVKYRNNYTEGKIVEDDREKQTTKVEYDNRGLPKKQTNTLYVYPDDDPIITTTVRTYDREFDDYNHEIKHYEELSGDITSKATVTRTFNGDFLTQEITHIEETLQAGRKTTIDAQLDYRKHPVGEKGGYSIVGEEYIKRISDTTDEDISTTDVSFTLPFEIYDRLNRNTLKFELNVSQYILAKNNQYSAENTVITANLLLTQYLSEYEDTNSYIDLSYNYRSDSESYIKIESLGYEEYSNKNLIISNKQIDNVATFVINDPSSKNITAPKLRTYIQQQYGYDELDRPTYNEGTSISEAMPYVVVKDFSTILASPLDTIASLISNVNGTYNVSTTRIDYTYNGDNKQPSEMKNVLHSEATDSTNDKTVVKKYDDYGRVLSIDTTSIIVRQQQETTSITKASYTYADPIRVPDGEKLVPTVL